MRFAQLRNETSQLQVGTRGVPRSPTSQLRVVFTQWCNTGQTMGATDVPGVGNKNGLVCREFKTVIFKVIGN